jgi:hypothetical protein
MTAGTENRAALTEKPRWENGGDTFVFKGIQLSNGARYRVRFEKAGMAIPSNFVFLEDDLREIQNLCRGIISQLPDPSDPTQFEVFKADSGDECFATSLLDRQVTHYAPDKPMPRYIDRVNSLFSSRVRGVATPKPQALIPADSYTPAPLPVVTPSASCPAQHGPIEPYEAEGSDDENGSVASVEPASDDENDEEEEVPALNTSVPQQPNLGANSASSPGTHFGFRREYDPIAVPAAQTPTYPFTFSPPTDIARAIAQRSSTPFSAASQQDGRSSIVNDDDDDGYATARSVVSSPASSRPQSPEPSVIHTKAVLVQPASQPVKIDKDLDQILDEVEPYQGKRFRQYIAQPNPELKKLIDNPNDASAKSMKVWLQMLLNKAFEVLEGTRDERKYGAALWVVGRLANYGAKVENLVDNLVSSNFWF